MNRETFMSDFRRFFVRGLAILLPTIVTLWLLWQAFVFAFSNVAQPINRATRLGVIWVVPQVISEEKLPEWFSITDSDLKRARETREIDASVGDAALRRDIRREYLRQFWDDHWYLNLTGLVFAIVLIYLAGVMLGNFVGRSVYARLEHLITQVPGFKQIYPHVKQLVDLVLGEKKMAFSKVVLVEYPKEDIWTVGFLTGTSMREIDSTAGGDVVSVFVPTSPTPFTGFTINVRKERAVELSMTVDEALRFVITAGVLSPGDKEGKQVLPPMLSVPRVPDQSDDASDTDDETRD